MADLPTTLLAEPRVDVPIGRTDGGLVYWEPSFARAFLASVYKRIGGQAAPSNDVLGASFDGLTLDLTTLTDQVGVLATSQGVQDTHLGVLDTQILTLQGEIDAIGTGGSDDISGLFENGTTLNTTVLRAALGPAGTIVASKRSRADFGKVGGYLTGFLDLAPSISPEMSARGGKLLIPDDNLPALSSNFDGIIDTSPFPYVYGGGAYGAGAPGSLIRFARLTIASPLNLAYQQTLSGFNLDARGTTQTNAWIGMRSPNPDNTENAFDGDPLYNGNKDYTAPHLINGDLAGCPGTGYRCEAGNGRLAVDSFRFLGNGQLNVTNNNHGLDSSGNDVVIYGHSAFGGNFGFGGKFGAASGLLMVTTNVWGNPGARSLTCGGIWMNDRRSFAVGFNVLNDWIRFDGPKNWDQGGVFCANSYATHDENFLDDCIAIDVDNPGSPDLRTQANNSIASYRTLSFIGNAYYKSTKVPFDTWQNIGGSLDGKGGTNYPVVYDALSNAAINCIDAINSDPECKPWGAFAQAFTVTGAPTTQITCTGHGLRNGNRIALKPGSLPTGLVAGVTWWVSVVDPDHFHVRVTPNGSNLSITGNGSGTFANLSTLPYGARSNATINFALMDSGKKEFRVGAVGNGNPGRAQICTNSGDEGVWSDLVGTFTFTYTSATNYKFNATGHGMPENAQVRLTTSGTLPSAKVGPDGFATDVQYSVRNATANDFQLAYTPGGDLVNALNTAGSGTHTFNSWEFTYNTETGNKTRHAGKPERHLLWGAQEFECAPSAMPGSWTRRAGGSAITNGDTVTIAAYEPYAFLAGASIAGFTLNLPTAMASSYRLRIFLNLTVTTGITYGGGFTLNGGSPALPTTVGDWTVLELDYLADNDEWNLANQYSTTRPWTSLGVSGSLAADLSLGEKFVVGPLTGNCTIANPVSGTPRDGRDYTWLVFQDGTGGRTVGLGTKFVKAAGDAFSVAVNGITEVKATYYAANDKYYLFAFKVLA